jgi:rhodanese-related sulfurtransferase/rubrerythrin
VSFIDLFPHVDEWSTETLQHFLDTHNPEDYQLLDLRQEKEFDQQHLPGARFFPVVDLQENASVLSVDKTTIVYCRNGVRSHAAAQVLARAGFVDVHTLHGGFLAWQKPVSTRRLPLKTMPYPPCETAEDHALFAWQLEENTRHFYLAVADVLSEPTSVEVFKELAMDEQHHKETIKAIWEGLAGRSAPEGFPKGLAEYSEHPLLEGGMKLPEALAWARDKSVNDLFDLAMAIEVNAYDHYLALQKGVDDENVKRLFELLADEEGRHVRRLAQAIDTLLPQAS